jgi:hypothetical protein
MYKLGVLGLIFLFDFYCAIFCTFSARAEVQQRANSNALPVPQSSAAKCIDSYQNLPAALRIENIGDGESDPILPREKQIPLQIAVWNFLCTRHHLEESNWKEILGKTDLPEDAPRALQGKFVKALVAATVFDVPGYSVIAIDGATIVGELDLTREVLRSGLSIRNSTFRGPVKLNFLRTGYDVDFSNSSFCQHIEAQSMRIDGSLYFGLTTSSPDAASDSKCPIPTLIGKKNAFILSINLTKSSIAGELSVDNTYIAESVTFFSVKVGRLLRINDSSLGFLWLDYSELGQLELMGSDFRNSDALWADNISVANTVWLDGSHFRGTVGMSAARIKSDLSFRGTIFDADFDLSLSKIDGDLQLGTRKGRGITASFTTWGAKSKLLADHTEVGFIRAPLSAWPKSKDTFSANGFRFTGFEPSYSSSDNQDNGACSENLFVSSLGSWLSPLSSWFSSFIGILFSSDSSESPKFKTCYYADWIARTGYTPSVIEWLQQKLKGAGDGTQAIEIGVLSKNHERNLAWADHRVPDWFGLSLSGLFIGYGYYP